MTPEQLAKIQREFLIKTEKQSAVLIESELMRVKREFLDYIRRNLTPDTRVALDSFLREFIALFDAEMDVASYRFARIVSRAQSRMIGFTADSLKTYLPRIASSIFEPDKEALQILIGRTQTGESLQKFFVKMKPDIATRAKNALVEGFRDGSGANEIAKRITNVTDVGRYNALRISRTETNSAFKSATLDFYQGAKIGRWIWVSSLDTRVCPTCFLLHGRIFKTNKKISTHPNDRCTLVPLLDKQPPIKTGIEIFKTLEKGVQKQLIGAARFELYENGTHNLENFIGSRKSKEYGTIYSIKNLSDLRNPSKT